MKKAFFLAGIVLPILSYSQTTDTIIESRLLTKAPKLGGFTITNLVFPIKANGNTITAQQPVIDIGIPVYKNFASPHPVLIKTGIRYQGLLLSGEKNIGSNNFHSLTVPLLINYNLTRATSIALIGSASISGDFKRKVETEDLIYLAGVRVGFRQDQAFKFGVTMLYLRDYTGKYLLPLPDFDWTISSRVSLTGIIPARITLKYKLTDAQSLGITGGLNNGSYGLNDQLKKQYIQLQQYSGGLLYDLRIGRNWKINLVAAHSFSQRLETFDIDQKISLNNIGQLTKRATNVSYRQNPFIFQAGLSYQFK